MSNFYLPDGRDILIALTIGGGLAFVAGVLATWLVMR